ncbi:hypothetical protein ANO11243_005810 [Dothideomycetidae sp. 11243]|nr:hypothetical protein ANO11243_005810 [fungal sp. No.11243]
MGYNSYNAITCAPNTTWTETTMHAMVDNGLSALGYIYFQIDCGWQGMHRQSNGSITYDDTAFPTGITPISQLATSLGLKWSMYTDQGVYACDTTAGRPGSLGYETQDAAQFAAWNVAYLKVDNCYVTANQGGSDYPSSDFPSRYGNMSRALQAVGIKGMLVCQWGVPYSNSSYGLQGPSDWTPPLATSYRVSGDMAQGWPNVLRITNEAIRVNLRSGSGPGDFADMDLLEVGNSGMTTAEQQTHYSIWAVFKSALMVSTDVPSMSSDTLRILSNKELIAINQDTLGEPAKLVQRFTGDYDLYAGGLANGDTVVLAFDQSNSSRTLTINFADLAISSADVTELWTNATASGASSYSQSIPAHGSIVLRLSNVKAGSTSQTNIYQFSNALLTGGAVVSNCPGCSNGLKAAELNSTAKATLSGIPAYNSTMDVLFDYINCDIDFDSNQGINVRGAAISVNDGTPVYVEFPNTGYEWTKDVLMGYKVRLSGFNTTVTNSISVTADTGISAYAPDFDRISVPNGKVATTTASASSTPTGGSGSPSHSPHTSHGERRAQIPFASWFR